MSAEQLFRSGLRSGVFPWACQSWLHAEALATLAELNEQCLELLCAQAAAPAQSRPALLAQLEPLWSGLDTDARRRAARCPFLLVDAGFTHDADLPWGAQSAVRDREPPPPRAAFFTVPRAVEVARLVLAYTWHLVRSERAAARLFLGLPARCAERMAGCSLRQALEAAEREPGLLRPRWSDRPGVWRELLRAAGSEESAGMDQFRTHGLQLLAADALAGSQRP
jgi:hypothetical protein